MIRVLLVDDQTLVRQGIRSLLELSQSVSVVGKAADGEEALGLISTLKPDVVLLDLRMPELDGLGVLRARPTSAVPPTPSRSNGCCSCLHALIPGYGLVATEKVGRLVEMAHNVALMSWR